MEQGEDEKRILENIRADPCLPLDVERDFVRDLTSKGAARDAKEARQNAHQIVAERADDFTCQGLKVPPHRFPVMLRLEPVSSLRYRTQDEFSRKGYNPSRFDVGTLSEEDSQDLRSLVDEYEGSVHLGNRLGIVWVAEVDSPEEARKDVPRLIDRLGLGHLLGEDACVVCVYTRNVAPDLHVPRALDAVDHHGFKVVVDCEAETGRTRPLTANELTGLPEAVHRSRHLTPDVWELSTIE